MPQATTYKKAGIEEIIAESDLSPGDVILLPSGRAGVVAGLKAVAEGDLAACYTKGRFEIATASATTFEAGDIAEFNATSGLAVASGNFELGLVIQDKAAGPDRVLVDLNEAPIADMINAA